MVPPNPIPDRRSASWPLVRRLFGSYVRPYRWRLAGAMLLMVVVAATTAAQAQLLQPILDEIFVGRREEMLLPVAAAAFAVFLVRGVATYAQTVAMNHVGQRIVADVQHDLFRHLLRADLAFFHATPSGRLVSHMVNDVNVMRGAMAESMTSAVRGTLTLAFLVALMFWKDWLLAAIVFAAFPVAGAFVAKLGRRLRKVAARTQSELGSFSGLLSQVFQAARHVKAYGMERFEVGRVGAVVERLFQLTLKSYRVSAASSPVMEFLSGLAIVVVILFGGWRVISGAATTGQFFAFIAAFIMAFDPMKRLARLNANFQAGLAAAERVFAVMDVEPEIVDRPGAVELNAERYGIHFEDVRFGYVPDRPALKGLTLDVPAGRTVALVGASGAGKSTVLNLVLRFYDVHEGRVLVGGMDVRDVTLASLRSRIALVSQEVALFDDTVRANIAYGRAGATDAEIVEAARAAAAHEFIEALPQGYDTVVGEHGIKLSGGQRQRIAIARAMLRNAPILLLDEATSALDTESERAVQEALRNLQRGRTTLVIAHRLSTVVDADRIYVLDDGRVAESGTHAELLRLGGLYSRLYGMQDGAADGTPRVEAAG